MKESKSYMGKSSHMCWGKTYTMLDYCNVLVKMNAIKGHVEVDADSGWNGACLIVFTRII